MVAERIGGDDYRGQRSTREGTPTLHEVEPRAEDPRLTGPLVAHQWSVFNP